MPTRTFHPSVLGLRITRARVERGWTQKELAARSGIDPSYVNKLERGRIQSPSTEYVGKLAQVLGATTDTLLHGDPGPDAAFYDAVRTALGTGKAHLFEAAVEALRELPPAERDTAIAVVHALVTNWPRG